MSAISTINNPRCQNFPFYNSLISYILKNLKAVHKEKLSFCCKLFYGQYPYDRILNELSIANHVTNENSANRLTCNSVAEISKFGTKFLVKENFLIFPHSSIYKMDSLSKVIARSCVKKIEIYLEISIKDFEILTESKNVEDLLIGKIIDGVELCPVENILARIPKAHRIRIAPTFITSKTSECLVSLKHKQKIQELGFYEINAELYASLFYEFLKKNVSTEKARIYITSGNSDLREKLQIFDNFMKNKFKKWEPKSKAPRCFCYF